MTRLFLLWLLLWSSQLRAAVPLFRVVHGARQQVGVTLKYDPSYARLAYPGGDVPLERGVCTDVIIRAYRSVGVDLQVLIHEDIRKAWSAYPRTWGLKRPDPSIDHRRVPNLETFFRRHGVTLPISRRGSDYVAGDIVTWRLPNGLPHVGLVSGSSSTSPLIIHNIGLGAREEAILFEYRIVGHFRYSGPEPSAARIAKP